MIFTFTTLVLFDFYLFPTVLSNFILNYKSLFILFTLRNIFILTKSDINKWINNNDDWLNIFSLLSMLWPNGPEGGGDPTLLREPYLPPPLKTGGTPHASPPSSPASCQQPALGAPLPSSSPPSLPLPSSWQSNCLSENIYVMNENQILLL